MAKTLALVLGIVFVIVGLLAFVSNPLVGAGAYFETNMLHDIVHLVTGILFIIVALAAMESVPTVLKIFGIIYILVAIFGFLSVDAGGMGNLLGLALNSADNWLHVVLGIVVLAAGYSAGKESSM